MLQSLESDIDKETFDKALEFIIKNKIAETSCHANTTCLSIPKEDQIKNKDTADKDNFIEEFNNFKNAMINEFESMKYSIRRKVNSFKNQLSETSEIHLTRTQSETDF